MATLIRPVWASAEAATASVSPPSLVQGGIAGDSSTQVAKACSSAVSDSVAGVE